MGRDWGSDQGVSGGRPRWVMDLITGIRNVERGGLGVFAGNFMANRSLGASGMMCFLVVRGWRLGILSERSRARYTHSARSEKSFPSQSLLKVILIEKLFFKHATFGFFTFLVNNDKHHNPHTSISFASQQSPKTDLLQYRDLSLLYSTYPIIDHRGFAIGLFLQDIVCASNGEISPMVSGIFPACNSGRMR